MSFQAASLLTNLPTTEGEDWRVNGNEVLSPFGEAFVAYTYELPSARKRDGFVRGSFVNSGVIGVPMKETTGVRLSQVMTIDVNGFLPKTRFVAFLRQTTGRPFWIRDNFLEKQAAGNGYLIRNSSPDQDGENTATVSLRCLESSLMRTAKHHEFLVVSPFVIHLYARVLTDEPLRTTVQKSRSTFW